MRQMRFSREMGMTVGLLLLWASLVASAPTGGASDKPTIRANEIRLEGTILFVNVIGNTFVLEVTSFTLPDGRSQELSSPKRKIVLVRAETLLHPRGDATQKVALQDLKPGLSALVVGKDLGSGQDLPAREVAIDEGQRESPINGQDGMVAGPANRGPQPTAEQNQEETIHTAAAGAAGDDLQKQFEQVRSLIQQTKYQQVIDLCTLIIVAHPDSAEAYTMRGEAYNGLARYDQAIADYTQALALNPHYAVVYYNRGIIYGLKGNHDQAIADYTQAIALNPHYADAYNNRGFAYGLKGDYDRAITDYTQAVTLNPQLAIAYLNRGNVYLHKGNYDRTIADYTQALALNPQGAVVYYNRGLAYSLKGDHDRAIADYTQAITLNPQYADAYNNRGLAYYHKQQREQARADWERAMELDPNGVTGQSARNNLQKLEMYYTVAGDVVIVHNTPWGDHSLTMDLPPGATGAEATIYVGQNLEPKIQITYNRFGVLSVTVDGKAVPKR